MKRVNLLAILLVLFIFLGMTPLGIAAVTWEFTHYETHIDIDGYYNPTDAEFGSSDWMYSSTSPIESHLGKDYETQHAAGSASANFGALSVSGSANSGEEGSYIHNHVWGNFDGLFIAEYSSYKVSYHLESDLAAGRDEEWYDSWGSVGVHLGIRNETKQEWYYIGGINKDIQHGNESFIFDWNYLFSPEIGDEISFWIELSQDDWAHGFSWANTSADLSFEVVEVEATPIPGTFLLLGFGITALIGLSRRKRR